MKRFLMVLAVVLTGCAPIGEMIQNAGQPTLHVASTTQQSIDQVQLEADSGPKARVAVSRFTDQSAKGKGIAVGYPGFGWYTPQIGNGMADMLSDALLQSNRFIVLDRQALQDVLQEQDLAAAGRVSREIGAALGQVEGADLLIKGSVSEFEPGSAGANAGIGLGIFGLPGALIGGAIGGLRQSHVAIIIQVVDARTSRILFSTTVEGKANDFDIGGALGGIGGGFLGGAGLGTWQKTPVEKAIRIAILQAVKELSSKTPAVYFRHQEVAGSLMQGKEPKVQASDSTVRHVATQPVRISPSATTGAILPQIVTVKAKAATLRDAAQSQGKIVTTLKAGAKLFVQGEDRSWYFVQSEDGKEGWISKSLTVQ